MEFLKCVDEENPNNYVVLTDGDIRFYEDVNGEPVLTMPITQAALYSIKSGESITTDERFVEGYGVPQVFISPGSVNIFNHNAVELDQEISIDEPSVTVGETGMATIGVAGRVIKPTSGNGTIVVPQSSHLIYWYRNSFTDLTSGIVNEYMQEEITQYAIPVVGASSAVAYAVLYGNALYSNSSIYGNVGGSSYLYYPWSYSMKVGIGARGAPSAWGETVSGTKENNNGTIVVSASCSGTSGAYVHVYLECRGVISGSSVSTLYTSSACPFSRAMWPVMVRVLPDTQDISLSATTDDDVYTALVIGR